VFETYISNIKIQLEWNLLPWKVAEYQSKMSKHHIQYMHNMLQFILHYKYFVNLSKTNFYEIVIHLFYFICEHVFTTTKKRVWISSCLSKSSVQLTLVYMPWLIDKEIVNCYMWMIFYINSKIYKIGNLEDTKNIS
jgi:hypothetical protein